MKKTTDRVVDTPVDAQASASVVAAGGSSPAADWIRLPLAKIDERHGVLRLTQPQEVDKMEASLRRHGQISPVVVVTGLEGGFDLVDGFKRLRAARALEMETLCARVLPVTVRAAKAALLQLNWVARPVTDFEAALVIQSLCRDDGLTQPEVGELLGRDPSWVSRRLALVERLVESLKEEVRLGLLRPTEARELVRLPRGKQLDVLAACREHQLSTREVARLVKLLLGASATEEQEILQDPHAVLGGREPHDDDVTACRSALMDLVRASLRVVKVCSPPRLAGLRAAARESLSPFVLQARHAAGSALESLDLGPSAFKESDASAVSQS